MLCRAASPSSGRVPTAGTEAPLWPQTKPQRRGLPAGVDAGSRGPTPDTWRGQGQPAVPLRGSVGFRKGVHTLLMKIFSLEGTILRGSTARELIAENRPQPVGSEVHLLAGGDGRW